MLFAEGQVAKIVDFGLAILVEKQHEEQGEVWATPYYVAPEKLAGQAEDFRSDLYSLAASLFHAISGRPPFISESSSMAELLRIKRQPVRLLNYAPHASTPTAYAIDRALSFKPEDRFGSYAHFIQSLEHALAARKKNPVKRRRPKVLRIGERVREGSWVAFAIIALVVGAGLYFWLHRPPPNARGAGSSAQPAEPDLSADMRFDVGRRQIVEERFADAAKTFGTLYEEGRLAEPKNSWAAVHGGLAEFFAGRPGLARTKFKMLADRASPTVIGLDAKLVGFFRQLPLLVSRQPDAEPHWDDFSTTTYEPLAFLIAGLSRWDDGDFEGSIALLRRLQKAAPAGEDAWVADYRPLVARYLEEYGTFRDLSTDLAGAATSPKTAEAALKRIPDALRAIRSKKLAEKLAALETEARQKVTAAGVAADLALKQKQADAGAAEEKLLTAAKLKIKELSENYRFTEAAALIRAVDVKLDRNISERDLLTRRVDWLVEFKKRLIEDINASGYPAQLVRKNGQKLLGIASRADDLQLEMRVQFGTLPSVKWTDISAMTILQMARTFMRPTLPQPALADREWQAGVFCLFEQLFPEGQALMDDAVARKPDYQNDRAQFFGQPTPAPAPEPAKDPAPEKAPAPAVPAIPMPATPATP